MVTAESHVQCRISAETKARFRHQATRAGVSESACLKWLVDRYLTETQGPPMPPLAPCNGSLNQIKGERITLRLLRSDRQMLRIRAASRSLRETTYLGMLVRAHLRGLAPVPVAELQAFREAVADLRTVSRQLEELTRIARAGAATTAQFGTSGLILIKTCEKLRDYIRVYIRSNIQSWECGHDETRR